MMAYCDEPLRIARPATDVQHDRLRELLGLRCLSHQGRQAVLSALWMRERGTLTQEAASGILRNVLRKSKRDPQ